MTTVSERFLRYVKMDTQSVSNMESVPSSENQRELAFVLASELKEMGASDVRVDDHCYVYAYIPSNMGEGICPVGFIAHLDTAPDFSGKQVNPKIVEDYDGNDILLNESLGVKMEVKQFPFLKSLKGLDLITTDGTTLLGADDKAGVAEIMSMAEYFLSNPSIPHGPICIAFTPDEEVGRGSDFFDVAGFGANVAYTVDGGPLGELEYETFNASNVKVEIHGISIHPGYAKDKMRNASLIGMEFHTMLPPQENPMFTTGYEGFFHLTDFHSDVEKAILEYIIRDHSKELFEQKKQLMNHICRFLNDKYGKGCVSVSMDDCYYNMSEILKDHMYLIDLAKHAMEEVGVDALIHPVRGGTDGARLSFMGLPCPNLCTGGYNIHGRFECIPVQSMEKTVEILIKIVEKFKERTV